MSGATGPVAEGRVDGEGRLVEADPRLLALNARAGGGIGTVLAVPQIATLARLAQRLGIPISRAVIAADGLQDVELWVHAEPEQAGVRLVVSGWQDQPAWEAGDTDRARDEDFLNLDAEWRWETDAGLRLTRLSATAGVRHGFDAAALLGAPLSRLFSFDADATGDLPILEALAAGCAFDEQPARLRESGVPVRLAAVPRRDSTGRFAGFAGAVLAREEAAEPGSPGPVSAEHAFGRRLDKALRQPLSRIVANADSIGAGDAGPLGNAYAGYAADIAAAGRHLMEMIDDLVDLQAIERSDFAPDAEPLDLADLARRAAGLLAVRGSERQVRIDRPAAGERLPASGEFRRVLQVLVNLIGNAVRHSPAGGLVWVRLGREGGMAAVIVADQGPGIDPADQQRIFEKFAQLGPKTGLGSGLGLYIARRLARAMGGDITVDSAVGQGARFVFTLPADDS